MVRLDATGNLPKLCRILFAIVTLLGNSFIRGFVNL